MHRIALLTALALTSATWAQAPKSSPKTVQDFEGPSFDCSRATSAARKLICDTPDLAATDMKNHQRFITLLQRGGANADQLDAQNEQFLATRDKCTTAACIRTAYQDRNKALDALEATPNNLASQDFPATDPAWTKARAWLGKPCGEAPATPFKGFTRIPGFRPLVLPQSWVGGFATPGGRFAFLIMYQGDDYANCRVKDVIALPPTGITYPALECNLDSDDSHGLGLAQTGSRTKLYWRINNRTSKFDRVPQTEIAKSRLRCSEPESGF